MTDRELLELAAKAAGLILQPDFAERYDYYMSDPLMWNPLKYDGDAQRLAVKLGMSIRHEEEEVWVRAKFKPVHVDWSAAKFSSDPYAATRRAIVRAAAEIGKNL